VTGTPISADATTAPADPLVYAFTAVAPPSARLDASGLLLCALGLATNPNAQPLRGPLSQAPAATKGAERTVKRSLGRRGARKAASKAKPRRHRRAHPVRRHRSAVAARTDHAPIVRRLRSVLG
jgi:hypothetical protein